MDLALKGFVSASNMVMEKRGWSGKVMLLTYWPGFVLILTYGHEKQHIRYKWPISFLRRVAWLSLEGAQSRATARTYQKGSVQVVRHLIRMPAVWEFSGHVPLGRGHGEDPELTEGIVYIL